MRKTIVGLFAVGIVALGVSGATTAKADPLAEMASPVSNPVNFEDPRIESDVRAIYVHHEINKKMATAGGEVDIVALQARYAINDRLSIIATKDGFVWFRPNSVLNDGTGFGNVAAGVKYAFLKEAETIASAGLRYEIPLGNSDVLQGHGGGIFNPFVSAATVLGPVNLIGYTGFRLPANSSDSTFFDASLHVDTNLGVISPLAELNLFQVLDGGKRLGIADEGQDYFNIGSTNADGKTMLTAAVGARTKVCDNISWGVVYEFPLAQGSGTYITDWRVTTDLNVAF